MLYNNPLPGQSNCQFTGVTNEIRVVIGIVFLVNFDRSALLTKLL